MKFIKNNWLKGIAILLALAAGAMFIIPFCTQFRCEPFNFVSYATFVGGTAGPLAALAGFLFIFLTFRQQQKQLKQQRLQFNIQSFEYGFFNMLEHHRFAQVEFVKNADGYARKRSEFQDEIEKHRKRHENPPIKLEEISRDIVETYYRQKVVVNSGQHLIKAITTLLMYIYSSNNTSKEDYTDILFNRLALSEKRFIVGYALFGRMDLSDREYNLLGNFAKRIDVEFHLYPHHFDWLQDIVTA